jgi:uncharacterized membrane protein
MNRCSFLVLTQNLQGFFGVALENGLLKLVPSVLGETLMVGVTGRVRSKNGPGSTATSSKRTS